MKPSFCLNTPKELTMKTLILIIFPILLFAQEDSTQNNYPSNIIWNDLPFIFTEYDAYKANSEIIDSVLSELVKSKQINWLKDLEITNCVEEKIEIEMKYQDFEPKRGWYENFFTGFVGASLLFLIGVTIGALL